MMLSKYVKPGQKLDLRPAREQKEDELGEQSHYYQSKVYDVLSEDQLEIFMPMEKTRLILLQVDTVYDLYFYSGNGLYQCFARVVDRYKKENIYIVLLELTSELRRYQRREFYRFNCALELESRELVPEEKKALAEGRRHVMPEELPLKKSVIADISGGGMRFIAPFSYTAGDVIFCRFELIAAEAQNEYRLLCKLLSVQEVENRKGVYEHRVKFINISTAKREEIIRYIFEQERKNRKKESGV